MKKNKNKLEFDEFNKGKFRSIVQTIAGIVARNPEHATNTDYILACLYTNSPQLRDKTHCPNCEASMAQYHREIEYHHANLLRAMGNKVRENLDAGMDFTEANKVHVQNQLDVDYTTKGVTAICRQLGLIAKVMTQDGKHNTRKGWLITRRGWDFLANKPVPKEVIVFRNRIIDRTEATTTIQEVLFSKGDDKYDKLDYIHVAGYQNGKVMDEPDPLSTPRHYPD